MHKIVKVSFLEHTVNSLLALAIFESFGYSGWVGSNVIPRGTAK